jgi:hypothetical protein
LGSGVKTARNDGWLSLRQAILIAVVGWGGVVWFVPLKPLISASHRSQTVVPWSALGQRLESARRSSDGPVGGQKVRRNYLSGGRERYQPIKYVRLKAIRSAL